uniref:EGF-like domain-containing protein n=1 Tax=Chromera velia CCMP2878 TaxID=1169474 RepID=A0A0G4I4H5_9ALVE|eukprot:Cvel_10893.t1-p1 / transcript=Cvel_10893.t1 / gene=Cvel_10893 / organism=Chromera_velia_CCMP2878 / gene_product=Fibrillin-2, putative / transcript_product=Fibrillin-2, putative / location=Cvel_scaffold668:25257-63257(+) / protein_length=4840 / sequence_SO=supercontig / SO=protein_coding / is_pseudo=false
MTVSGSSDDGTTWTQLGSMSNQTGWSLNETRWFDATDTVQAYRWFKFHILRTSSPGGVLRVWLADFLLDGSVGPVMQVPPADIGESSTWTQDGTVQYGGLDTFHKTHATGACAGLYRVGTNTNWAGPDWKPSGVFDNADTAAGADAFTRATGYSSSSNSICGDASDCNVEFVLYLPCYFSLSIFGLQARDGNAVQVSRTPTSVEVSGSSDGGATWTLVGSFSGETGWSVGEIRRFTPDSTAVNANAFKFNVKRTEFSGVSYVQLSGFLLYGRVSIPPSDIGHATTWVKDPSVTYGGFYTAYKDYAGSVCAGRYRAMSNTLWYDDGGWYTYNADEYPISGGFDQTGSGDINDRIVYNTDGLVSGTSAGSDSNVELVIQTPCSLALSRFSITARINPSWASTRSASKMAVSGSIDRNSWTELASFDGETSWTGEEVKFFSADVSLGLFNYFKFDAKRVAGSSDDTLSVADITLFAVNIADLCGDGSHNCNGNATCANAGSSFTCACNSGFTGDGISCSALTLIPPSDIGRGDTWTKDATVTHNSVYTLYKDYGGSVCGGRYRAKANVAWKNDAGSGGGFGSNEWPISGTFDRVVGAQDQRSGFTTASSALSGTDAASNSDVQAILQTPCLFTLHQYAVQGRNSVTTAHENPSKMSVSGSLDCSGTWTDLGSYEGEINWVSEETRSFTANKTLGAFNCFRFTGNRISQAADASMTFGDVRLYGAELRQIPPSDIGTASTWVKDPSVTYNGLYTAYKDYSGSVCAGRYRAMSNTAVYNDDGWYSYNGNECPISGAFDQTGAGASSAQNIYVTAAAQSGTSAGSDSNAEVVIKTPCSLALAQFSITARSETAWAADQSPSKMEVSGSTDGSSWTQLASFDGETTWTGGEVKSWSADASLGLFNYFKFDTKRISRSSDYFLTISDITLFSGNILDLCGDGSHNCDANAECANSGGSFTCSCNIGFSGDGVSCSVLDLIPPSDIGKGDTWTKDSTVTYNSRETIYKDYTGSLCPGRYRAKANLQWANNAGSSSFGANEWPPSGAFDGVVGAGNQASGYSTSSFQSGGGTDTAGDKDVHVILQTPCFLTLHQFAFEARSASTQQTPSKMSVDGSLDCSGTWTELGSFEGEINWSNGESRGFSANSTLGAFNCFRFTGKKTSSATEGVFSFGDIELYGVAAEPIPPSDIGHATTWVKDPSVTYNGLYTAYKDYSGNVCAGRYRAMSNTLWFDDGGWYTYNVDEYPVSGAFDQTGAGTTDGQNTFAPAAAQSGTSAGSDSNAEVVIKTPCNLALAQFSITARSDSEAVQKSPSKMEVSGSTDGISWTQLASFDGETTWTGGEVKSWSADASLGLFNYFKFDTKRISGSSDNFLVISDITLFPGNIMGEHRNVCGCQDLCGDGAHNCHANAACKNVGSSFSCSCNDGFEGNGVSSCSALLQIPPADIGTATDWKKDPSVLYAGYLTSYIDYAGATCPGRFPAMTNLAHANDAGWYSYGTDEWPISGAFDQTGIADSNSQTGYHLSPSLSASGTAAGSDSNIELIIQIPCGVTLSQYSIMARRPSDWADHQSPSKVEVSGSVKGTSWTQLSSFEGEILWTADMVKFWSADTSLGAFSYFKFAAQRISGSADEWLSLADITLYVNFVSDLCGTGAHNCDANAICENQGSSFACECNIGFQGSGVSCTPLILIPPSDVGGGGLWTKDDNVTYGGITSVYTDYGGSVCAGRFRALTNKNWLNKASGSAFATDERPPSGAFDRLPEVFRLESWAVQARSVCCSFTQSPAKMTVSGSNDTSSGPWIVLGSFEGHRRWEAGEKRGFDADPSLGAFTAFKFNFQRIAASSNGDGMIADIELYTAAWTGPDECSDGTHNCDANAACTNTDDSFTCACNGGYAGNGTDCIALTQLPPSDIGRGDTWTEDSSVTYSGLSTAYKDYAGAGGCTGRYRVRTNTQWYSSSPWIWPPQGAFDRTNDPSSGTLSFYVTDPTISGTSAGSDADVEVILELPCLLKLHEFGVWSRSSGSVSENPSKAEVFGSTDLTSWTLLGSFSGETSWVNSETKTFSANNTAGPFNHFKFVGQRVNSASDARLTIADIILTGEVSTVLVPPSDIGSAPTWTKDGAVTYGGFHTFSKDYASGKCAGTYRARTDTNWYDNSGATGALASSEWPPSAAFDNTPGGPDTQTGWAMANGLSCSQTVDCNVELILETPCSLAVSTWWVQAETGTIPANTPSAMVLSGSSDDGVSWTELGSFTGETVFSASEVKNFTANETLGAFTWFKFFVQRSGQPSGSEMFSLMSGVGLYGEPATPVDECTDALHDCDGNAACNDTATSFTCTCNSGFAGSGVNCSIQLPPADIGSGETWSKDNTVTYQTFHTFYKDVPSGECAGRYRVRTDTTWLGNSGATGAIASNEWPPSGAFDNLPGGPPVNNAWAAGSCSLTVDCNVEMILETPCNAFIRTFGVEPRISSYAIQAPSALTLSGSDDDGASWTALGSFSGETGWVVGQQKNFTADHTLGPYNWFRFSVERTGSSSTDVVAIGGFFLYEHDINECSTVIVRDDFTSFDSARWSKDEGQPTEGNSTISSGRLLFRVSGNLGPSGTPRISMAAPTGEYRARARVRYAGPSANFWTHLTVYDTPGQSFEFLFGLHNWNGDDYVGLQHPALSVVAKETPKSWAPLSGDFIQLEMHSHGDGVFDFYTWTDPTNDATKVTIHSGLANPGGTRSRLALCLEGYGADVSAEYDWLEVEVPTDEDECSLNTHNCHGNATCADNIGSFECTCNDGWMGDGLSCSNENECTLNTHNCNGNATCADNVGSFECSCNSGFEDALTASSSGGAFPENILGGGWRLVRRVQSGTTWHPATDDLYGTDVYGTPGDPDSAQTWSVRFDNETYDQFLFTTGDESVWLVANRTEVQKLGGSLTAEASSSNGSPHVVTGGWSVDLNECTTNVHDCHGNATCNNTAGSFDCTCNDGWIGSGVGCSNEDECSLNTHNCNQNATCADNVGSFECTCNDGWMGDGLSCSNENECNNGTHNCHANAQCTDTIGSFECSCNAGFTAAVTGRLPPTDLGGGASWTKDNAVQYGGDYTAYVDSSYAMCPGRYRVGTNVAWFGKGLVTDAWAGEHPPTGLFDNTDTSPFDIWRPSPACPGSTWAPSVCDHHVVLQLPCSALMSSFSVQANSARVPSKMTVSGSNDGTTWTEVGAYDGVTDWGPSNDQVKSFSANATIGPYEWFQFKGERLAQTTTDAIIIKEIWFEALVDEDECSLNTHNCHGNATCADNVGSFECTCNDGWMGDGLSCSNADECSLNTDDCDGSATCSDAIGSFECACNIGYSGSGVSCTAASCNEATDTQPNNLTEHVNRTDGGGQVGQTGATATFTYSCPYGYSMVGTASVVFTCVGEGVGSAAWHGMPPTCGVTGGPVVGWSVAEICNADGSTSAANVTAGYNREVEKIQQWQADNSNRNGAADLESMDTELDSAAASGGGGGGGGGGAGGGASSSAKLGAGMVVVSAPPVSEPSTEDKNRATDTAIKLLTAVDDVADNLAAAVPVGKTVIVKTETLSIAVKTSPPGATEMVTKSDTAEIAVQLADAPAARDPVDSYRGQLWKVQRISLPSSTKRASSNEPKSLTLMESVVSPAPFAGSRTREGGFVLEGLTPYVRMAARQGGELIGAGRVPRLSASTSSSRAGASRSSRRLSDSESSQTSEDEEDTAEEDESQATERELQDASVETSNIATVTLTAPQMQLLLEQRSLIESDWEAYRLGRSGGVWEVECTQLDVQNEQWTTEGCTTTGAVSGVVTADYVECTCEIRALEAVFVVGQRYVEPPVLAPASVQSQKAILEELPEIGFLFLLQTVAVASVFIFGTLIVLILTAKSTETKLLPTLPEVPPAFSLCDCRKKKRTRMPLKDIQMGSIANPKGASARSHKYTKRNTRNQQAMESNEEDFMKTHEEDLAAMRALFQSQAHAARIRKYLNPRRIIAFHMAQGVRFDLGGLVEEGSALGGREGEEKEGVNLKAKKRVGSCQSFKFCRCFSRLTRREMTLGGCDAPVMRLARRVRRIEEREAVRGYDAEGDPEQAKQRQESMWQSMVVEMKGRQYELGLPFDFESIRKRLLTALRSEQRRSGVVSIDRKRTSVGKFRQMSDSDFDSDSDSSDSNSQTGETGLENTGSHGGSFEEGDQERLVEQAQNIMAQLSQFLSERRGSDVDSEDSNPFDRELEKGLMALKNWSKQLAREARDDAGEVRGGRSDGGASSSLSSSLVSLSDSAGVALGSRTAGRGEEGEIALTVHPSASKQSSSGELFGDNEEQNESAKEIGRKMSSAEETARRSEEGIARRLGTFTGVIPLAPAAPSESAAGLEEAGEEEGEVNESVEESIESAKSDEDGSEEAEGEGEIEEERGEKENQDEEGNEGKNVSPIEKEADEEEEQPALAEPAVNSNCEKEIDSAASEVEEEIQEEAVEAGEEETQGKKKKIRDAPCGCDCASSMKRSLLMIRISNARAISEISDSTLLTEALTFAAKILLCLCLVLLLSLTTVIVGETDARHTNRKPAEVQTALSGFGLEGYGDLEAFGLASAIKSLIVYLSVEFLFAAFVNPAVDAIWAPENSCGRVRPENLIVKQRGRGQRGAEGGGNTIEQKGGEEKIEEGKTEGKSERRRSSLIATAEYAGRRVSVLAEPPEGQKGVQYFDLGGTQGGLRLSPEMRRVQVPRWLSARVYVKLRKQEVFAQRCLLALTLILLLLLMVLFVLLGLDSDSDSFPLRHKQFVLREYLVSNLLICSFNVGFPVSWGFFQAVLVWMSCRVNFLDRVVNAFPSMVRFPELTRSRHVSPGTDVVKNLDAGPTADWVVPPPSALTGRKP